MYSLLLNKQMRSKRGGIEEPPLFFFYNKKLELNMNCIIYQEILFLNINIHMILRSKIVSLTLTQYLLNTNLF
jgi:hypothetical protein